MTGTRSPIRVLPAAAIQRIAAGEIIERPASVVKELVENALDAGATQIRVDVRGAGLDLIRVGDDGAGIPPEELRLACEWHATSKITGSELDCIRTLGFRGEALPSIASVGELTVLSCTADGEVGRRLTLRDGEVVTDGPAARPRGTTVTVRNLFQRVPARLAALGSHQTEISQLGQTLRRLALAAPGVSVSGFFHDRLTLRTSGSGDLTGTLIEVYGEDLAERVHRVGPVEAGGARIEGVVAGPELTRPGRGQVNLIVNGRWVQPRGLLALLEAAYRPVLPRGRHPILVLTVHTDPELIDVNVHPTKLEVRLRHEREIGEALGELVRAELGRRAVVPRVVPSVGLAALETVGVREERTGYGYETNRPIVTPALPTLVLLGQLQSRLILLEGEAGLFLVDQHRAHERVIYERLMAGGSQAVEPVALPEPILVELAPAQATAFQHRLGDLGELGFQWEEFGGRAFLLRSAPPIPGVLEREQMPGLAGIGETREMGAAFLELLDEPTGEGEGWRERLLTRLSCRTAVRRGRALEHHSMRTLIEELGRTASPAVCPHGSPLLMQVSGAMLEREFRW